MPVGETLAEAWKMRRVWWFTASARTKARYARTIFGNFWLGLSNLFSIAALVVVYGTVFKVEDINTYVVYLGIGLVVWNTIAAAVSSAPNLFENNRIHLQNTNMNPIFYTLEEWSFQFQTFIQSFLLVILVLSFFKGSILINVFSTGLLPLLNLFLFLYWLPVLICLIGARYRDFYQLVPIILQLVFLLSPILYEKNRLGNMIWIANLNPFFRILSPVRDGILNGQFNLPENIFIFAINILGSWLALRVLNQYRASLPFLV